MEFRSDITVELLGQWGADITIAESAWVSSNAAADGKKVRGLIRSLMKRKHGTPFEDGFFKFLVNAPRSVSIEHMRHRIGWSYSSASLRYREQEPIIYIPPRERPLKRGENFKSMTPIYEVLTDEEYEQYVEYLKDGHKAMSVFYNEAKEIRPETEALRFFTSEALYLPYICRCNPRSLMHFLSLRTHREDAAYVSFPMYEIQLVADQLEQHFARFFPLTYEAFNDFGRVAP